MQGATFKIPSAVTPTTQTKTSGTKRAISAGSPPPPSPTTTTTTTSSSSGTPVQTANSDPKVSNEVEYATLKQTQAFDELTELMNYPVEIKFHLNQEVVNTQEDLVFTRGVLAHGLPFHTIAGVNPPAPLLPQEEEADVEVAVKDEGEVEEIMVQCTPPISRSNLGLREAQIPSPVFSKEVMPDTFIYRSYELFHLNIIDGKYHTMYELILMVI